MATDRNIPGTASGIVDGNPKSTAQIAGHPLHPMIIPFPIAFFVSTFLRSGVPNRSQASCKFRILLTSR